MAKITEKISENLAITYEGAVNWKELQTVMKKWCSRYDYDIEERTHSTKPFESGKVTTIEWVCDRKPDDYHKFLIKVKIEMKDLREAEVDGEKLREGTATVTYAADLQHDYEGRWQRPTQRFLRAFYDKFVLEEKEAKIIQRLKQETNSFMAEVKRYLNVK